MARPKKRRDESPGGPCCAGCGAAAAPDAGFCVECGAPLGPSTLVYTWVARVPLVTNRFILYDFAKVLAWTMAVISVLMLVALGLSSPGSQFWGDYLKLMQIFALVTAGIGVMFLLISMTFFGNSFVMAFQVGPKGIGWDTRMKRAKWASRTAIVLGLLRGKPGLAGAGLLAASQETGGIPWNDVHTVRLYPKLCTVSIMNSWRVVIRLFCTPENYRAVAETVQRRAKKAVVKTLTAVLAAVLLSGTAGAQKIASPKPVGSGFNFFSEKEERAMGQRYARELNKKLSLVSDAGVREFVERIGRRLEAASPRPGVACEYQIVNTREVNAFAVPGGFVYLNRGLIDLAQSEDEVAAVIAHEVGHVIARHGARQLSKQLLLQGILAGAVTAANAKSKKWADIAAVAGGIGTMLAVLKYSRNDEYQADALALQMLQGAGYHPAGLVGFFGRMDESARKGGGAWNWLAVVSTHPPTRERIRRAELAQGAAAGEPPAPPSPEFASIKQVLGSLPLPPPNRDVTLSSALRQLGLAEASAAGTNVVPGCSPHAPVLLSRDFLVNGNTVWLNTGIQLAPGDSVEIEATGEIQPIKNNPATAGPDGLPGTSGGFWKPISSAETGALLARLEQKDTKKDFLAGGAASFCAPFHGDLKLGINDSNPFDNRGQFHVRVTVRRMGAP